MMAGGFLDLKNTFSKFSKKKVTTILVIAGVIGIMLIFLSDFFFRSSSANTQQNLTSSDASGMFETKTAAKLEDIISKINGVGRVKVMVTVESGVENIYETDSKASTSRQNGGDSSGQVQENKESSHVVIDNQGGGQQALLTKQIQPEVLGVVIVCDGGNNPDVREGVINAVSTALCLPTNKISVNKMQPK